jgi:hypothetical protein
MIARIIGVDGTVAPKKKAIHYDEPEPCNSFHPYTSNPQLCKCGKPYTEHKAFMEVLIEKERKRKEEEEYQQKRAKLMELCTTEIDPEAEDEDIVDLGNGWKLPRKQFEMLRDMALKKLNEPPAASTVTQSSFSTSWVGPLPYERKFGGGGMKKC